MQVGQWGQASRKGKPVVPSVHVTVPQLRFHNCSLEPRAAYFLPELCAPELTSSR